MFLCNSYSSTTCYLENIKKDDSSNIPTLDLEQWILIQGTEGRAAEMGTHQCERGEERNWHEKSERRDEQVEVKQRILDTSSKPFAIVLDIL